MGSSSIINALMSSGAKSRASSCAKAVLVCATNRREIADRLVADAASGADRLGRCGVPAGRQPGQHPLHHHRCELVLTSSVDAGDV
jgi:hypothetical protein